MRATALPATSAHARDESSNNEGLFIALAPFVFVFLWSTGFIGSKYGLRYAEPLTLLALRMGISAILLTGIALAIRGEWPKGRQGVTRAAIAGMLLHAGYLGGVFVAIDHGMGAGLAAIIVGLQPVLTAILAQTLLRESVTPRQWAGLVLGFSGVALVVLERTRANDAGGDAGTTGAYIAIVIGLLSTTLGAIYQKRFGQGMPLMSGTAIQYAAAGTAFLIGAVGWEAMEVRWTWGLAVVLVWMVLGMSLGAVTLLLILIKRSSVSRISSYLYLVPPLTALEAYLLFDERLTALALVGMVAVAAGVALVVMRRGAIR